MSKLAEWWIAFWRPIRLAFARRRIVKERLVGRSVRLDLTPTEVWDVIEMKRHPGWLTISEQLLNLLGDMQDRMAGCKTKEELDFWRGALYGAHKTRGLVAEIINISEDEQALVEAAQMADRPSAVE